MLSIVKKLTSTNSIGELATAFVQNASESLESGHIMVFQRPASHNELLPLACSHGDSADYPSVSMDEINNPLVYALISGKKCFINTMARLIDVGIGFEQFRSCGTFGDALVVFPIFDQKKKALGILAARGPRPHIEAWSQDTLWSELIPIFTQLFSSLTTNILQDKTARAEQAFLQERLEKKVEEQARRFVMTEYVGSSPSTKRIRSEILDLANSSLSVLITGETGVGKDHVASLIHKTSPRGTAPFVPVNCAAISKDLIESELFGSVKGAFTGAQLRAGLVAAANGGTLFLDEIGDMPIALQVSLLRLLNEKKYRPVGSNQEQTSDFRLICATNKPLPELIKQGLFREDLYFRIRQALLELPPLRQRAVDISPLCWYLIQQYNSDHQRHIAGIEVSAIDLFRLYDFPGNVRELKYLILAACERTTTASMITRETVGSVLNKIEGSAIHKMPDPSAVDMPSPQDLEALLRTNNLPAALDHFEQLLIRMRLSMSNGSRQLAADSLGIPKRTLARKCQRWNLGIDSK